MNASFCALLTSCIILKKLCGNRYFCKKIWRFFQENPPTFTGKFNGFSRELRRFLHESLPISTGTFNDFSGKLDGFCCKICRFLFPACPRVFYHNNSHQSKTRQILVQKSSNFFRKIVEFSWRIYQVKFFCNYPPSNFSVKIINFPHKNCQNFPAKLVRFSYKKHQI